jgi:hypothetical protein
LGWLAEPAWEWGADAARSLAITPDGQGLLILNADGEIYKAGTAASGPLAALGAPSFANGDARSLAVMPDGLGYVVLDSWGHVWKYGSAAAGYVGDAETPLWVFTDTARDIVISSWMGVGFGYYVLDATGHVWNGGIVPPVSNPAVVGADRYRAIAYRNGKPLVLRNDGVAVATS